MNVFDRTIEKKRAEKMTRAQKIRRKHAIWNYYKKKSKKNI